MSTYRFLLPICLATVLVAPPGSSGELESLIFSADITIRPGLSFADDEEPVGDDGSGVANIWTMGFPSASDVDALHLEPDGNLLVSFDVATELHGVLVEPGDVAWTDGSSAQLVFDASVYGLPGSVDVDAVGRWDGHLILSFAESLVTNGATFDDEDVVLESSGALSGFFFAASAGIDPALDLDAVSWSPESETLYVSFDGPGSVGALRFEGRDVLAYEDGLGWRMARRDRESSLPMGQAADLDALYAVSGLFADGFETGSAERWSSSSP